MFDSCVSYNISEEDKKRFHIITASPKILDNLNFSKNDLVFFSPKDENLLSRAVKQGLPSGIINAELLYFI